eukprot:Partr_v1_DN29017_c0_g2_i3_m58598 putative Conserved hypothetical protein
MGFLANIGRSITQGFGGGGNSGDHHLPCKVGPFLRFESVDIHRQIWRGSVLILIARHTIHTLDAPLLVLRRSTGSAGAVAYDALSFFELDTVEGYTAWRVNLEIPIAGDGETAVTYCVHEEFIPDGVDASFILARGETFTFYVQARGQAMRWYFVSCNGITQSVPKDQMHAHTSGIQSTWWDIFQSMKGCASDAGRRFHMGVNIGDQIYLDGVFNLPHVVRHLSDIRERKPAPLSIDVKTKVQVQRYVFASYCKHFTEHTWAYLLASVPQVMMWDDHDVFDGYGSYAESVQSHPLVRSIFAISERFYLLFQHHTTSSRLFRNLDNPEIYGNVSHNFLKVMDTHTAIMGLDMRSQRTLHQCVAGDTYSYSMELLQKRLPASVKHLIVISPVPVIWPTIFVAEMSLKAAGFLNDRLHLRSVMRGNRLYQDLMNPFGNAFDLLDDLVDQWGSRHHATERKKFISILQSFAQSSGVRVTIISGDVHASGVGRLSSKLPPFTSKVHESMDVDISYFDYRQIYNVTSSAVCNYPPPKAVVKLLHLSAILSFKRVLSSEAIEKPDAIRGPPMELTDDLYRECIKTAEAGDYDLCCRAFLSHKESPYLKKFLVPAVISYLETNSETLEEFFDLFTVDVDGTPRGIFGSKIMDRRNWCEVRYTTNNSLLDLQFVIHVEKEQVAYRSVHEAVHHHQKSSQYTVTVPQLLQIPPIEFLEDADDSGQAANISVETNPDEYMPDGCLPLTPWIGMAWYARSRSKTRH